MPLNVRGGAESILTGIGMSEPNERRSAAFRR